MIDELKRAYDAALASRPDEVFLVVHPDDEIEVKTWLRVATSLTSEQAYPIIAEMIKASRFQEPGMVNFFNVTQETGVRCSVAELQERAEVDGMSLVLKLDRRCKRSRSDCTPAVHGPEGGR